MLYLILLILTCYGHGQAENSLGAEVLETNMASAMQNEAILLAEVALTKLDDADDRKSHVERHFDTVYGRKWACFIVNGGGAPSAMPERKGQYITFKLRDNHVTLYRIPGQQYPSEHVDDDVTTLATTTAKVELSEDDEIRKRLAADRRLVIHHTFGFYGPMQNDAARLARDGFDKGTDYQVLGKEIAQHFRPVAPYANWTCVVTDRDLRGRYPPCPYIGRYFIFSVQAITVEITAQEFDDIL